MSVMFVILMSLLSNSNSYNNHVNIDEYKCENTRSDNSISEGDAFEISKEYIISYYGEKDYREGLPYSAERTEDVWIVRGYLPEEHVGGSLTIFIDVHTGCVVHVISGR